MLDIGKRRILWMDLKENDDWYGVIFINFFMILISFGKYILPFCLFSLAFSLFTLRRNWKHLRANHIFKVDLWIYFLICVFLKHLLKIFLFKCLSLGRKKKYLCYHPKKIIESVCTLALKQKTRARFKISDCVDL